MTDKPGQPTPVMPYIQATLDERIRGVAKAVCEVTGALGMGQHGFMAPCSRCMRLVIAIQNREDNLPTEREAKQLDDMHTLEAMVQTQNMQVVHLSAGCRCPNWPWCVPHGWMGSSIEDAGLCEEHGHVDPAVLEPEA